MAIFATKTKKEKAVKAPKEKKEKAVAVVKAVSTAPVISRDIILRPRITEKSGIMNESANVYTFEVAKNASKHSVAYAIKALYKVTPVKVRTISLPAKNVFIRGKHGVRPSVKKALVYLKKGDTIDVA